MKYIILAIFCLSLISCTQSTMDVNQQALKEFDELAPNKYLPDRCIVMAGFTCSEFKVEKSGKVTIVIINNNGASLSNVKINMDDCTSEFEKALVENEEQMMASFECEVVEERFKKNFEIDYKEAGGSFSHKARGELSAVAE